MPGLEDAYNYINQVPEQTMFGATKCAQTFVVEYLNAYDVFFYSIVIFFVAILIHEIGHLLSLRAYKKYTTITFGFDRNVWRPYIRTGKEEDYAGLMPDHLIFVYASGIIAGFCVIGLAAFAHQFYLLLIGPYIVGCFSDIKKIWSILTEKQKW